MAEKKQLLTIEPNNELKFVGPFTQHITSHMRLTNPTDKNILFKIKTTAPKKYCVRPNSGALTPKGSMEIAIVLQPFIFDPNEKNKHKFMVQSLVAPDSMTDMTSNVFDIVWKNAAPELLMDSKLKCVFELPEDDIDKNSSPKSPIVEQTASKPVESTLSKNNYKRPSDDSPKDSAILVSSEVLRYQKENSELKAEINELQAQLRRSKVPETDPFEIPYKASTAKHGGGQAMVEEQSPMLKYYLIITIIVGVLLGKYVFN